MRSKKYHPIEYVYKDYNYFLGFAIKKTKDTFLAEDLVQEVFLQLLTMNHHKLLIILDGGKIKTYVCKIMLVKYFSKKSQFHKKNVKYKNNKVRPTNNNSFIEKKINEQIEHTDNVDDMLAKIDNCLKTMDAYDTKVFKLYYETGLSFRKLEEETGISQRSLRNTITKVRDNIKIQLNAIKE
ncbi:MAG: hypothetical protein Unbinned3205contig1001_40 [Prokaryotic dsDNA virus sp.]|nr:MAG: hypothetical protein Unbinned3205contig1001_40 [Prokaryotic dsDNA virus sp.]|tara:strand:+ start:996 stop:1541 length:546 start_codon:yes stop_codon:yes gene_type:complete